MLAAKRLPPVSIGLMAAYQKQLDQNGYLPDAAQAAALVRLQNLVAALQADTATPPKGVYLHGPVGRGKSWLMEMFCEAVTLPKRRVHFHAFMQELHARLHATTTRPGQDLMQVVASQLAGEATVLCFDEFYITNIADAMLLGRLFQALFQQGVIVVATSNWAPDDLFQGGMNRDRFMPFVKQMLKMMDVVDIGAGRDYRLRGRQGEVDALPPYYIVHGPKLSAAPQLQVLFEEFATGAEAPLPPDLPCKKREGRAAWFTFADLCDKSYGREQYLELMRVCDTLVVEGVPVFTPAEADSALRFITLVDICYEHKRRMIVSAAAAPSRLCPQGDAAEPFKRTASRLMQLCDERAPRAVRKRPLATAAKRKTVKAPKAHTRKSIVSGKRVRRKASTSKTGRAA